MKTPILCTLAAALAIVATTMSFGAGAPLRAAETTPAATQPAQAIDFDRARELMQKQRSGQTLTAEEQDYLDRARKARAAQKEGGGAAGRPEAGGKSGSRPAPPPAADHLGLIPLNEMTAKDTYKGQDGGLYGGGKNEPPAAHARAALKELAKIVPLDSAGKPSADGKIVFLSVGMSNTTHEFSAFKPLADAEAAKNPKLVIVDGAQGGMAAKQWNSAEGKVWGEVQKRLAQAGVTDQQVQVVWLKQAQQSPANFGEFPKHAQELQGDIIKDIQQVKAHYPNVRVLYLSSRIYAGYATSGLNPEPYAYEGAFAVRWIIQDQVKGDKDLNYDASQGEVKAPLVLWGPYLWADGITPRKSDGLIWKREDLAGDGTHPSITSGREKVAKLLLEFFKTDPMAGHWFTGAAAK